MSDQTDEDRLFFENGASWYWVLAGPASALAMLCVQLWSGIGPQPLVPLAFLVLVSGFVSLQIKAARIHTSVELTGQWLREGTQTIGVHEIVKVYPEPTDSSRSHYDGRMFKSKSNALTNRALQHAGLDPAELAAADTERATVEKWQAARALGELTGVPRGRTGIGLRLTGGRTAQAWARNHQGLRAALTPLVDGHSERGGRR
jgi:hypothetical protein